MYPVHFCAKVSVTGRLLQREIETSRRATSELIFRAFISSLPPPPWPQHFCIAMQNWYIKLHTQRGARRKKEGRNNSYQQHVLIATRIMSDDAEIKKEEVEAPPGTAEEKEPDVEGECNTDLGQGKKKNSLRRWD